MQKINVTCAIIEQNDKILITQRGANMEHPFKWEFPGGKIKQGETAIECITREILEELQVVVIVSGELNTIYHSYPSKNIELIPFVCQIQSGIPKVTEHSRMKWIDPGEIAAFTMLPADIPVHEAYCRYKNLCK